MGEVSDSYQYNGFGELTGVTATADGSQVLQITYTRDGIGRVSQAVVNNQGTTNTYGYTDDPSGRLTQVTVNGNVVSQYGFDTNGNRTSATTSAGSVTATYDAQDRLTQYGTISYAYLPSGQLASKTDSSSGETTKYQIDSLGNLRGVTLSNGLSVQYVLDGQGRRIGKKVNGTMTQEYIYQDALNPVAELDGSGNLVAQFVYASKPNSPDYMIKNGITYRIVSDQLGSPLLVIDTANGSIAESVSYDEFGNVLSDSAPGTTPFGFAGCLLDADTKLCHLGARELDMQVGRFVEKDPLLFWGGDTNLYSYSLNNPVNWVDPEGTTEREPIDGAGGPGAGGAAEGGLGGAVESSAQRPDVQLNGGRSGENVKYLEGPPNSIVRGSPGRIYITDANGNVIWDITSNRAVPVEPGIGRGSKIYNLPDSIQELINQMHGSCPK